MGLRKIEEYSGTVKSIRMVGVASLVELENDSGTIKVYIGQFNLPKGVYKDVFKKGVKVGSSIQVTGYPFIIRKGIPSINVQGLKTGED